MNIPTELAHARKTAETAWKLYNLIVDDERATKEQRTSALLKANELDNLSHQWYMRWQAVGGTSDIESIVDAEMSLNEKTRAAYGEAPENFGTHVVISGGEVMELDAHLEASYEERTEEDMPF